MNSYDDRNLIEEARQIRDGTTMMIGHTAHLVALLDLVDTLKDSLIKILPDAATLIPKMEDLANERARLHMDRLQFTEGRTDV